MEVDDQKARQIGVRTLIEVSFIEVVRAGNIHIIETSDLQQLARWVSTPARMTTHISVAAEML